MTCIDRVRALGHVSVPPRSWLCCGRCPFISEIHHSVCIVMVHIGDVVAGGRGWCEEQE